MSYKGKHRRKHRQRKHRYVKGTGREFPVPPPRVRGTQTTPTVPLDPKPPTAAVTHKVGAVEVTEYFQTKCKYCGETNIRDPRDPEGVW